MQKQILELRNLNRGQKFELVGLEKIYRNLQVLAVSEGSVSVKGETSADDVELIDGVEHRNWHPLSAAHTMSPRTEVYVL